MVQFAVNRNSPAVFTQPSTTYPIGETGQIFVIEDINLGNSRIFIDKQPYDVNSLAFLPQERFHFNNRYLFSINNAYNGWFSQNQGIMYLYNHAVSGTAWVEDGATPGAQWFNRGWGNQYHWNMDPINNPVRPMMAITGNNYFYGISIAYNSNPSNSNYGGLWGSDITQNALQSTSYGAAFYQYFFGNMFLYEDTVSSPPQIWTQTSICGSCNYITASNNYTSQSSIGQSQITGTAQMDYLFMGRDSNNNPYFVQTQHNTANEPITVSYVNASSKAVTAVVSAQLPATSNSQTYNMTIPSNIRTDSTTRKVFYTMHWDSSNNLAPVQYIWGPGQIGNISKVNCTMLYPGANTYANYAAHGANTNATSTLANIWFYRPYQFSVGSNNYITFTHNDMGAGWVANSATRFANTLARTWLTFQIGSVASSNDNVLTFHSALTFPNITDFPHTYIASPANSNVLAVVNYRGVNWYNFNTTSGWTFASLYPGRIASVGFDQTARCWAYVADNGNPDPGSLHIVSPTSNSAVPTNIGIVYSNSNPIYAGSNVSITANVNAYDNSNNRMVANLTFTIDGYSMIFANGAKSATITTSNSADTQLSITVTSGGTSSLIPSINI